MEKSLKGHLLAATPQLVDPNFFRTVLLIFDHSEEGAAGVILNRPTEAIVGIVSEEIFEEPIDWDKAIHLGGPVPGPLMMVHTREDLADQTILPGLFTTAEADKLRDLVRERTEPSLLVVQYAGWGPGQLDRELEEDSWSYRPATIEDLFETDVTELWKTVTSEIGRTKLNELLRLGGLPADPRLN